MHLTTQEIAHFLMCKDSPFKICCCFFFFGGGSVVVYILYNDSKKDCLIIMWCELMVLLLPRKEFIFTSLTEA